MESLKVQPNNDIYYYVGQPEGVLASVAITKVPMRDTIMSLIASNILENRVKSSGGGNKSEAHTKAQILLGRTFADTLNFVSAFEWRVEGYEPRIKYFIDCLLLDLDDFVNKGRITFTAALEVDRYVGKKKEIKNMKRRDNEIMLKYNIPVIRFDLDSFKSKGPHSYLYRNADALIGYVRYKRTEFKHNPIAYMEASQRD